MAKLHACVEEIKRTMFSLSSSKAQGLNGFTSHFFKIAQHVVGEDGAAQSCKQNMCAGNNKQKSQASAPRAIRVWSFLPTNQKALNSSIPVKTICSFKITFICSFRVDGGFRSARSSRVYILLCFGGGGINQLEYFELLKSAC